MIIFEQVDEFTAFIAQSKNEGNSIGLIPTMGALHSGHIALLNEAQKSCDISVVSIFVNPTQFNDPKDFEKYPNTIEEDIYALEKGNCDVLFYPTKEQVYPTNLPMETFDFGTLEIGMEGAHRKGHFKGVAMVVKRLFEIVQPNKAFFGLKDYQQYLIVKTMAHQQSLPVEVIGCETVREASGLAKSSRNLRLTKQQKDEAKIISKSLLSLKNKKNRLDVELEKQQIMAAINSFETMHAEYVEIADGETCVPITNWDESTKVVAFVGAFAGEVRLIDNMIIIP